MTIYTATLHRVHNYGAMLQAYALQQVLIDLGYKNEILDYSEIKPRMFIKASKFDFKKITPRNCYRIAIRIVHASARKKGYDRFELFYNKYLKKTKHYDSIEALRDIKCDAILVGSDQLWNFNITFLNEYKDSYNYFLLDFLDNTPKVSYAVSMGGYRGFSNNGRELFLSSLRKFEAISVREDEARNFLQSGGIKSDIHVDPVFLLPKERWEKLVCDSKVEFEYTDYILCYDLVGSANMQGILDGLRKRYSCKTIILASNSDTRLKGDIIIRDAGPLEFLKLISNSRYVITTSFHGIAFAVLFEKSFYAVMTHHAPARIKYLLENLGLENQIIYDNNNTVGEPVFDSCRVSIRQERERSIRYLTRIGCKSESD